VLEDVAVGHPPTRVVEIGHDRDRPDRGHHHGVAHARPLRVVEDAEELPVEVKRVRDASLSRAGGEFSAISLSTRPHALLWSPRLR